MPCNPKQQASALITPTSQVSFKTDHSLLSPAKRILKAWPYLNQLFCPSAYTDALPKATPNSSIFAIVNINFYLSQSLSETLLPQRPRVGEEYTRPAAPRKMLSSTRLLLSLVWAHWNHIIPVTTMEVNEQEHVIRLVNGLLKSSPPYSSNEIKSFKVHKILCLSKNTLASTVSLFLLSVKHS